jgi:hypothetical protein
MIFVSLHRVISDFPQNTPQYVEVLPHVAAIQSVKFIQFVSCSNLVICN